VEKFGANQIALRVPCSVVRITDGSFDGKDYIGSVKTVGEISKQLAGACTLDQKRAVENCALAARLSISLFSGRLRPL
jgi:hypothetical protein